MINISKTAVKQTDTSFLSDMFSKEPYIYGDKEHYKLLTYLAKSLNNVNITELGSLRGISAECLAQNKTNKVISYDISTQFSENYSKLSKKYTNLQFIIEDILFDLNDVLFSSSLVFVDIDPHNGEFEKKILDRLIEKKYSGLVIFDDIHLNTGMKEFWVYAQNKCKTLDLTEVGHHSGTGLIIFNKEISYE